MTKLVSADTLKFLDVISSDRFVHGYQPSSIYDEKPIEVGYTSTWSHNAKDDETRSSARFLVLSVGTAGMTEGLGGPFSTWTLVTAQRLNDDGTYNPEGEIISFPTNNGREDEVSDVTLVARMHLVTAPIE